MKVFSKVASLDFIPAILVHGFQKIALFKILENFLRDIFVKHFLKVAGVQSLGWNIVENNVFVKNI